MILLKSLLSEDITSQIEEASEELYGIRKQPDDTCPLINELQAEAKAIQRKMYNYEKLDEQDLKDILWSVSNFLYDITGGNDSLIERIRDNTSNIRGWGQEWKEYAKSVDPKVPEHQQPQNLPRWGHLI